MLQLPEGGFLSVGNRKFRVKRSVTPPLTPVSVAPLSPLERLRVAMPTNLLTERRPPRARSSRFSTLAAATDKIVVSRNVLIGLCLTTFAFGIVTTLVVDHIHARASEAPAAREPEPVVLQTTPIELVARPAAATAVAPAAATGPAPARPPLPSSLPSSSLPSPLPSLPSPAASTAVQPRAAAEAVVVQLPPIAEKPAGKSAARAHLPPPVASRQAPSLAVRQVAAAAVRTSPPPATRKGTGATAPSGASPSATEAAPDEDPVMPAPIKKKWVDPFDQ